MKLMYPKHIKPAEQLEREGEPFKPQAHFTGVLNYDLGDVELGIVELLIYKYQDHIVAQHSYMPIPGTFSVELQFNDNEAWLRCRKEYHDAFTKSGKIKKSVVERVRGDVALAQLMEVVPKKPNASGAFRGGRNDK